MIVQHALRVILMHKFEWLQDRILRFFGAV